MWYLSFLKSLILIIFTVRISKILFLLILNEHFLRFCPTQRIRFRGSDVVRIGLRFLFRRLYSCGNNNCSENRCAISIHNCVYRQYTQFIYIIHYPVLSADFVALQLHSYTPTTYYYYLLLQRCVPIAINDLTTCSL